MADNDLLEELLNKPSASPPGEMRDSEDTFLVPLLDEINQIEDSGVRNFTRAVLLHSPTFWVIPSSFSGTYHPPDEFCEGGNVLHTQRVVRVVAMIALSQERTKEERDILLSAAILHDVTKGIYVSEENISYDPMHPYTVDRLVEIIRHEETAGPLEDGRSNTLEIEDNQLAGILRLIRTHLGRWGPIPETYPVTSLEWTLHLADAIASKLHHLVEVKDAEPAEPNLDPKQPGKDPV